MAGSLELLIYGAVASLVVILLGESLMLQDPQDIAPETLKFLHLEGYITQETMRTFSSSLITVGIFAFYTIVPITHILGTKQTNLGTANWQRKMRHFLFQFLSWTFYVCCVLLSIAGLYASGWFWSQAAGFVASLGVLGMIAQVFMVSSFYVLETRIAGGHHPIKDKLTAVVRRFKDMNSFLSMNILLAVIAGGLAVMAEYSWWKRGDGQAASIGVALAAGLSIIVLFNTHGLGGRALHQTWQFWQPWVGGAKFVTLQILSWILFGVSIVLEVSFIVSTFVVGLEVFVGVTALAGVLCVFSELLLVGSLFFFRPDTHVLQSREVVVTAASRKGKVQVKSELHLVETIDTKTDEVSSSVSLLYTQVHRVLMVLIVVNMQFVPFILLIVPFLLCGLSWADASAHWVAASLSISSFTLGYAYIKALIVARARKMDDKVATQRRMWRTWYTAVLGICLLIPSVGAATALFSRSPAFPVWASISICHFLYVWATYNGTPEISGCRALNRQGEWHPLLVRFGEELRAYFDGRVIRTTKLDPNALYVMGFHPHGIMPVTLMWLKLSNEWRTLFPRIDFSVLTASVIHLVPFMRDMAQLLGSREVSRESFRSALEQHTNVLLVPGGQAEMLQSRSHSTELKLVTRHAGFIKQAIEQGASLLPILSLGEVDMLDNVEMPNIQNWFLKRVGMGVPFLPYGTLYLPLPRPVPITVIVGEPIQVVKSSTPSDDEIKEMKIKYYKQIKQLFEKHKQTAKCAHQQLIFNDDDLKGI